MQIKILLFSLLFSSLAFSGTSSKKYQLNVNAGIEQLKAGQTRTAAANCIRFAVSTKPRTFRAIGAFELLVGSSFLQGNFVAGFHVYPFSSISRNPILPFFGVETGLGLGKLNEELRYDFGYDAIVGVDLHLFKKSGFQIMVKNHNAEEESLVIMLGVYFQG